MSCARIILIADTYDAMTTTRPYRKGMAQEFAYKELKKFAGRQFDEQLVQVFLRAHSTWGKLEEELSERASGFRIDDEDLEDLKTVRDAVDYVPATLGMMIAEPFIDEVHSGHNLASLERLAARLPKVG